MEETTFADNLIDDDDEFNGRIDAAGMSGGRGNVPGPRIADRDELKKIIENLQLNDLS